MGGSGLVPALLCLALFQGIKKSARILFLFLVEMDGLGKKLQDKIENDVEVTGTVTKDPGDKNRIFIAGYEVLPEKFEPGSSNQINGEEMY